MTVSNLETPFLNVAAALGTVVLTGYLLIAGEQILLPLVLAIFASYLIAALGHRIERIRIRTWHPPAWLGLTGAIAIVLLVVGVIVQLVAGNVAEIADRAPQYQTKLQGIFEDVAAWAAGFLGRDRPITLTTLLQEIDLRGILGRLTVAFQSIAGNTFQVLAYLMFLLLERGLFDRKLTLLFSDPDREKAVRETLAEIGRKIEAYVLIKTGISLLNGVIGYIVLSVFGVDFAGFWALLIFVLNFIPYVGSPIAMLFPTLVALLQFGSPVTALFVLGSLWVLQALVENVLEPRITGQTLNLSPLVMVVSLSAWGAIWGVTGMILSVPLMVMLMITLAQFPKTRPVAILMSARGELT